MILIGNAKCSKIWLWSTRHLGNYVRVKHCFVKNLGMYLPIACLKLPTRHILNDECNKLNPSHHHSSSSASLAPVSACDFAVKNAFTECTIEWTFFKKWTIPGLFFVYFCRFKQTNTLLTTVKKCPSSIRCWDSTHYLSNISLLP